MSRRRLAAGAAVALLGCACARQQPGAVQLTLWGLGREGEVVRELIPEFERTHPGVTVRVQQIPWSAAHEKLLTAFVGEATPDVAQVGNTWIPELAALGAMLPLDERVAASAGFDPGDFFPGPWGSNVVDGRLWGLPWYVDTRLLFYRKDLLRQAGYDEVPRTWSGWREAMARIRATGPPGRWGALLPTDEWFQPVIFALQKGSTILDPEGRHGAFREAPFREAAAFYLSLFEADLAPAASINQIANRYQQIAAGELVFYVSGPWDLGEFSRRLPPALADAWTTAPLPVPDGTPWPGASLAGGSSLVLFRGSRHPEEAWQLMRYLTSPPALLALYRLAGDLPPRASVWGEAELAGDQRLAAFRTQLEAAKPTPLVPEWERVATAIGERMDAAIRGGVSLEDTLAALDADVEKMLAKRRALLDRKKAKSPAPPGGPSASLGATTGTVRQVTPMSSRAQGRRPEAEGSLLGGGPGLESPGYPGRVAARRPSPVAQRRIDGSRGVQPPAKGGARRP
ncbi:MAG TPA: sugar ABC transporter substrate-binding protein [Thermoanaerobaculia bacterium]|nr:sugar ABC transporter substrate-binding protein [Thermoanaerobaculia bacterium]